HAAERARQLEGAADAAPGPLVDGHPLERLPFEDNVACRGHEGTGDAVDERAFSGPVWPDHAQAFARAHVEIDALDRGEPAEPHLQPLDLQLDRAHGLFSGRMSPRIPLGAAMRKAIISRPTSSRLKSELMVTMATCWTVARTTAPITGPSQCPSPPISAMAMVLTA